MSTADLLAVILGTGTRGNPVLQVAEHILQATGGITQLAHAAPHELMELRGIGMARATRIAAAFQLGRRALEQSLPVVGASCSPVEVYARLAPRFRGLMQEVFVVLPLDARNTIIDEIEVARGCLTHVDVHPREVFRPLIRQAAAAGVVAHNHPSGDAVPSREDVAVTHRLRAVGEIVGIPILDHIIIGDTGFVSLSRYLEA